MEKRYIITCNVSNSICSIMSNVTGFAKKFIMDLFPDEFFKGCYITTSLAANEQAKEVDDKILIKEYPYLSINPQYSSDIDNTSMGVMPLWRRGYYYGFRAENTRYGYKKIFLNDEDNIYISAIPNRNKFIFNFKIKVESYLHKIDLVHLLRHKFNSNDQFFYNHVLLESQIPNIIIKTIANIKDLDLTKNDDIILLKQYLKKFSVGNINERIYTGTGLKTFSYNYVANILIIVETPPDIDNSMEKNNMSESANTIDFTLNMELWIPNNFMLECGELPKGDYTPTFDENKVVFETTVDLRPPMVLNNRMRINWSKFITEANIKIDTIDISSLFTQNTLDFIKKKVSEKDIFLLNKIFEIVVYKDNKKIELEKDYKINWKDISIEMLNPYFNYIYYIGIYADQELMNIHLLKKENN